MPSVRDRSNKLVATSLNGKGAQKEDFGELETLAESKKLSLKKASEYVDGAGEVATEQVFPITVTNDPMKKKRKGFVTIQRENTWNEVKVYCAKEVVGGRFSTTRAHQLVSQLLRPHDVSG